ncbi:MAG: glycosyltransferase [Actinomycetota bacterium]
MRAITCLCVGEPAQQALALTRELGGLGFDARLAWGSPGASDPGEGIDERTPPAGMPATHLPWLIPGRGPVADLQAFRSLAGLMRRWRPQVVHTHLAKAGALGRVAARHAGVPVVVHTFHGHTIDGGSSPLKAMARVEAERRLAARTDALIAPSPAVRDQLLAMGIGREDRWHVMPEDGLAGSLARLYEDLLARSRSTSGFPMPRAPVAAG